MRVPRTPAVALIALLMLAGTSGVAAAQEGPSPEEIVAGLDGFEKMYGRTAAIGFNAMPAEPSGWFVLSAYVLEFDSEEHAAAGAAVMMENGAVLQFATMEKGAEIEEVELALDIEHTATKLTYIFGEDGETGTVLEVVAQDGKHVYGALGMATAVDPAPAIESIMKTILENEVSNDVEKFHRDGTSMGGLWAKLPSVEDIQAIAADLTDIEDEMVTPGGATPAA